MNLSRLQNIDRRVIYLVLLLAITVPLVKPLGLPVIVGKETRGIYDQVERLLPGDVAAVFFDYSPGSFPEMHPQALVALRHLLSRPGVKVIGLAFTESGPLYATEAFAAVDTTGKVYGEDFVNLGYLPGGEAAMSAFASDIHKSFPRDQHGTAISDLPMMSGIKSANDIDFIITIAAGTPGVPEITRQIQGPYQIALATGLPTISAPIIMPYLNSGQIVGLMSGLRGSAEYEMLIGQPGKGVASMDAISASHLAMIAFILLGNVGFWAQRLRNPKKRG